MAQAFQVTTTEKGRAESPDPRSRQKNFASSGRMNGLEKVSTTAFHGYDKKMIKVDTEFILGVSEHRTMKKFKEQKMTKAASDIKMIADFTDVLK